MGKDDCIKLIDSMTFNSESMWLKDFYLSKINLEVR